ncbi:hypothetical protein C2G38_2214180 [Gigaspora rosea]|uniref:Uncharacterized protein n=1 Tax=Gigaspora rosea TaxID=44941 RepID=A0A397UEC8_9GLOM|nr:hypothetical protein C2G38_2214180 [Gigaspora rosea]
MPTNESPITSHDAGDITASYVLIRFLLCKHLVNPLGKIDASFFWKIQRNSQYPLIMEDKETLWENIRTSTSNDYTQVNLTIDLALDYLEKSKQKKWLRGIELNFKPIQKMVNGIKDFERAKKLSKTWSGLNKNTFY